jgi:lipopolysaccharide transport system permease protein
VPPSAELIDEPIPPANLEADQGAPAAGTLTPGADLAQSAPGLESRASSAAAPPSDDLPLTVIERQPGWHLVNLRELWRYRELLVILTWRDIKVRYKQTVLGAAWAVLQPFATMVVFSIFFGRLADMPTGGIPYPLFVFGGLLPWFFFSNAISSASQSVVGNQNLVTKIYFPRLIIPFGAVGAGLVDFLVAFVMLVAIMLYYLLTGAMQAMPGLGLLIVPVAILGLVIAAIGVGTLLAALTVAYRDFRYIVPFMLQLLMFATPAIYMQANTVLHPNWRAVLPLNPAHGLISSFRAATMGGTFEWYDLAVSGAMSVVLLLVGCYYFRRVERTFADII